MILRGFFMLFIFCFASNSLQAQIIALNKKVNIGTLEGDDKRFADFYFVNKGKKGENILRVDQYRDREVKFLISKNYLLPGDTGIVRVQLDPLSEGNKSKSLLVYTSDKVKPIKISLNATVKDWASLSRQNCPDFNDSRSSTQKAQFQITIKVYNALTEEPIADSKIIINEQVKYKADKKGSLKLDLNPGLYSFRVTKENYKEHYETDALSRADRYKKIHLYPITSTNKSNENEIAENKYSKQEKDTSYNNKKIETKQITDPVNNPDNSKSDNYSQKKIDTSWLKDEQDKENEAKKIKTKEQEDYQDKTIDTSWMDKESDDEDTIPSQEAPTQSKREYKAKNIDISWLENLEEETEETSKPEQEPIQELPEPPSEKNVTKEEETIEKTVLNETESKTKVIEEPEENSNFSVKEYKPNTIVFIIDRSISMGKDNKLEIAKNIVSKLIKEFRSIDNLGVITYSTESKILIPIQNGKDVKSQLTKVKELTSFGKTYGSKGLKEAYKMVFENFSNEGNNEVFLVSDGAFTDDIKDIKRIAKRGAMRKIKLSVIGIKNQKWTEKNFNEIAGYSNGNYLHLNNEDSSGEELFELIKSNSKR